MLLYEAGKLFERIFSGRIVRHLSEVSPDLSESQFGFREGCSTIDAMLHLTAVTEGAVGCGDMLLAVSLDMANGQQGYTLNAGSNRSSLVKPYGLYSV